MTTQSEALRLANELESYIGRPVCTEAAAELRRLHNLCAEWEKKAATWLASPEAAKRLDGYRELAQRVNTLEAALRLAQPEQEPVIDCPRCGHCCPQSKPEQEMCDVLRLAQDALQMACAPFPVDEVKTMRALQAVNKLLQEMEQP